MSDMQPPGGDYTGVAALVAALTANVTALFRGRGGVTKHSMNNAIHAAVLPVAARVTETNGKVIKLETHYEDIDRRLSGIERGQERLDDKIDRLLDRDR